MTRREPDVSLPAFEDAFDHFQLQFIRIPDVAVFQEGGEGFILGPKTKRGRAPRRRKTKSKRGQAPRTEPVPFSKSREFLPRTLTLLGPVRIEVFWSAGW